MTKPTEVLPRSCVHWFLSDFRDAHQVDITHDVIMRLQPSKTKEKGAAFAATNSKFYRMRGKPKAPLAYSSRSG